MRYVSKKHEEKGNIHLAKLRRLIVAIIRLKLNNFTTSFSLFDLVNKNSAQTQNNYWFDGFSKYFIMFSCSIFHAVSNIPIVERIRDSHAAESRIFWRSAIYLADAASWIVGQRDTKHTPMTLQYACWLYTCRI
jgi:hypothetical protein